MAVGGWEKEFEFLVRVCTRAGITHHARVAFVTLLGKHTGVSCTTAKQIRLQGMGIQREIGRKKDRLVPSLHSKPPKPMVADAAATRTPGIRIVQTLVFWTNNLDPTLDPRHRLSSRLLPSRGIIGSDISEHLLWHDRFETHRPRPSWLLVRFIFYKHRPQQICIVGGVLVFERPFGRGSLV